ncbi:hypothetical protein TELCIR_02407 [Teladorsagia circumcincta]|uniref:ADAMTS cysteine-rich domain-containing protein n=1 Tax=Teladorsagia circumcincta TaxID=45464 RepID=A0A2G9V0P6_TELCI|nr:hypothetical protein TELCIR_02407 [Teladorsagia circumcincta]
MAYVGNICKKGDSASIVEDIGAAATAVIAAHELGHRTPTAQCVRKFGGAVREHMSTSPQEIISLTPGEMIGLRQQCQISFGPHYGVCPNKEYFMSRDVCARVWCKDRTKRRSEPCETKTYFPALDGTECGRSKGQKAGNTLGFHTSSDVTQVISMEPDTLKI